MSLAMAERFHASLAGIMTPERAAVTLQERLHRLPVGSSTHAPSTTLTE